MESPSVLCLTFQQYSNMLTLVTREGHSSHSKSHKMSHDWTPRLQVFRLIIHLLWYPAIFPHPQDTLAFISWTSWDTVSHCEDLLLIKQRISLPSYTLLSFLLITDLSVDESVTRVTAFWRCIHIIYYQSASPDGSVMYEASISQCPVVPTEPSITTESSSRGYYTETHS